MKKVLLAGTSVLALGAIDVTLGHAAAASVATLAGASYGVAFAAPFVFSSWAKDDFFFTRIPEGQAKAIDVGDSFDRAWISFRGHHLNNPNSARFDPHERAWEVLENERGKPQEYYEDQRPHWMQKFGLYWVGIPGQRKVHDYDFEWNEFKRTQDEGARRIWARKERTKIFMVAPFPYVMIEEGAKTAEGVAVKVTSIISIRITNLLIVRQNADWLTQVEGAIGRAIKNFIGKFGYMALLSETDETDPTKRISEDFSVEILKLNAEVKEKYGATICAADLQSLVLTGDFAGEHEKTVTLKFTTDAQNAARMSVADTEAYETTKRAEANATAIRVEAQAKADGQEAELKVIDKHPEAAALVRTTDALTAARPIVVGKSVSELIESLTTPKKP